MKVAIIHDFLTQDGGAERVLKSLKDLYPEAPIYTLVYHQKRVADHWQNKDIRPSFLQKLPFGKEKYQWYLSLMPAAIEQHDLQGYDMVISSSSAFAKGVITPPETLHLCYCHTPTRYLWSDTHSYIEELGVNRLVKRMLPPFISKLRLWDKATAERVDHFVANSKLVQTRIKKYYRRDSELIYPPVEIDQFHPVERPANYFLAGGRMVPYKKLDMVIRAFNRLGIPLKIFGFGPLEKKLRAMAKPHIEFLGKVKDHELTTLYQNALAFIHPQIEDFGIMAVESMASGRPVIAYRGGGALETVVDGVTGKFFDEPHWEALGDAVIRFYQEEYDSRLIRAHAEKFSSTVFQTRVLELVNNICHEHRVRR